MKRKFASLMVVVFLLVLLVQGCWSRREVSELAIVIGVAVDLTPDGKYLLTIQFSKPGEISGG